MSKVSQIRRALQAAVGKGMMDATHTVSPEKRLARVFDAGADMERGARSVRLPGGQREVMSTVEDAVEMASSVRRARRDGRRFGGGKTEVPKRGPALSGDARNPADNIDEAYAADVARSRARRTDNAAPVSAVKTSRVRTAVDREVAFQAALRKLGERRTLTQAEYDIIDAEKGRLAASADGKRWMALYRKAKVRG